jgi:transcriptional regulator with XRE-family HTH domain
MKWPSAEVLERLADALKVKPYQLFLEPDDAEAYQAWLQQKDQIAELGEKLIGYFENRRFPQ